MDNQEFENAVQAALANNKIALMGRYKNEIGSLLHLSKEQLSAIIPDDITRQETYDNLISVVKEASRANIQQADLQNKITALGEGAVKIAKLAGLFA